MDGFVSCREAEEIVGRPRRTLLNWVQQGRVRSKRDARGWFYISLEDVCREDQKAPRRNRPTLKDRQAAEVGRQVHALLVQAARIITSEFYSADGDYSRRPSHNVRVALDRLGAALLNAADAAHLLIEVAENKPRKRLPSERRAHTAERRYEG